MKPQTHETMMTKEKINELYNAACEAKKGLDEEKAALIRQHEERLAELSKPYLNAMEGYYDQVFLDSNGRPVKPEMIVSKGYRRYLVVRRNMSFYDGEVRDPLISLKYIDPRTGKPIDRAKVIFLLSWALTEYTIVDDL